MNRSAAIRALRAFYEQHGRSPYSAELNGQARKLGLPGYRTLVSVFGGIPEAFHAAGIPRRDQGPNRIEPKTAVSAHIPKPLVYIPLAKDFQAAEAEMKAELDAWEAAQGKKPYSRWWF